MRCLGSPNATHGVARCVRSGGLAASLRSLSCEARPVAALWPLLSPLPIETRDVVAPTAALS